MQNKPGRRKRKQSGEQAPQQQKQYDSSLKALLQEQAVTVVPRLLEDAIFLEERSVEVLRPTQYADRVSLIKYRGILHILHLEFQSSEDEDMAVRMLTYHVGIYEQHRLPVISILIYLFPSKMAESPWREMSRREEILKFQFRTIALWEWDAEEFLRERMIGMYPLLPTMKGATSKVLLQAIEELKEHYRHDDRALMRRLVWFRTLLERAETVPPQDKVRVQERLTMLDNLLEQAQFIQEIKKRAAEEAAEEAEARIAAEKAHAAQVEALVAKTQALLTELQTRLADQEARFADQEARLADQEARLAAEAEARARDEESAVQTTQEMLVALVENRFPPLAELTRERVEQIRKLEDLRRLGRQLRRAPDEATARFVLDTYTA